MVIPCPTKTDNLTEGFNRYLDESIANLSIIPPASDRHRISLKNRIATLEDVKQNFNRIVKKVKDDSDTRSSS